VRMLQGQFVDGDNIVVDVAPDGGLTFAKAPATVPA